MTRDRPLIAMLHAALLAACGGGHPSDSVPVTPAPPHLAVSATTLTFSASVGRRNPVPQRLTLSNSGGGAMARPVAVTSAPWLSAFVSGFGPDYVLLVEVNTADLPAGDQEGSVTLASNTDNSPDSVAVTLHLSPGEPFTVGRVEIYSGGFLLTSVGEASRLWAVAYDTEGRALDVLPTFRSLSPDVIGATADGIVGAVGPTGSAQLVAEAGGVSSPPVVGVVATPAPGALVIEDWDLLTSPTPLDPEAPFGPGWRYQVRLFGNVELRLGSIILTRGREHVAGRVVDIQLDPESSDFVLEVVPLADIFSDFQLSETFPLRDPVELATPTFACTTGTPGSGGSALLRRVSFPPPELEVSASVTPGMTSLALAGTLSGDVTVDVSLPAGFDDTITCKAPVGELNAAWPGALALVLPSRIPYGAGFALSARTGGDLTLTSAFRLDATAQWGLRAGGATALLQGALDLRPEVAPLSSTSASAYAAEVRPYLYASLSGGPGWPPGGGDFELVELRAGLSDGIDWAPPPLQAADPAYGSRWELAAFAGVAPGSDPASTSSHLSLLGGSGPLDLPTSLELPLWRSPTGTLAADPPSVAPDGAVTLTVTLADRVAPPGRTPVGRVEIYRRSGGPAGPLALLCSVEPLVPEQQVFSCPAGFPDAAPGDRIDLYAFAVDPTGSLTTEVSPDGAATVTVE